MKLANLKPIKAISWPFKKVKSLAQGKEVKKISSGSEQRDNTKREGLDSYEVKVNEAAAIQAAEDNTRDSKDDNEMGR